MKRLWAGLQDQTRRRARRLWLQYGILWSGAVVTGLVAVLYARLIELGFTCFQGLEREHRWLPLILMPAAGALCVWLTRRYFAGAEGSGIPQVIAALGEQDERRTPPAASLLSLRIVAGKIGVSFLAILSGFTLGREGPTVQIGAALMYNMRRFYPRPSAILEKRLVLAGAAAGLAAAFNTPLAGIVFAIEELSRSFEQRASGVVITTIIFAGVVALGLTGNYTYFGTITADADRAREVSAAVILCGLLMGGAGGGFCWLLLNTFRWIPAPLLRLRSQRPVAFGALCGLIVAVIGVLAGGVTFGSGYVEAKGLLSGQENLSGLYPLLKMAAMVGSYLPGVPGGIFAPSLSIGAGFGNLLHMLFGDISLPVLIALAMVGYLAAVTQSPITSFVIVMEMINGHALVISLMATALLASRVSRFFAPPLYEALSARYRKVDGPASPARLPASETTTVSTADKAIPDAACLAAASEPAHPVALVSTAATADEPVSAGASTSANPLPDAMPVQGGAASAGVVSASDAPSALASASEPARGKDAVAGAYARTEALPAASGALAGQAEAAPSVNPRQPRKRAASQAGKRTQGAKGATGVRPAPASPALVTAPTQQEASAEEAVSLSPEPVRRRKRLYRQADLFE